jgi:hypothetical protein
MYMHNIRSRSRLQASVDLQLEKLSNILNALLPANGQPEIYSELHASSVIETASEGRPSKQDRTANLAGSLPGMESATDEHEKHSAGRALFSEGLPEAAMESDNIDCDSSSYEAAAQQDGGEFVPGSSPESGLLGSAALPTAANCDGDGSTTGQDSDRRASASNGVQTPLANVGGGGRVQTENAVKDFRRGCSVPLSRGIETGAAGSRFARPPPRGTDQAVSAYTSAMAASAQVTTMGARWDGQTQQDSGLGLGLAGGGRAPLSVSGGTGARSRPMAMLLTAESGMAIHALNRSVTPERTQSAATANAVGAATTAPGQQEVTGLPGDAADAVALAAVTQGAAVPPWMPTADRREPHGQVSRDGTEPREQPTGGLDTALPGIMVWQHDLGSADGLGRAAGSDNGPAPR